MVRGCVSYPSSPGMLLNPSSIVAADESAAIVSGEVSHIERSSRIPDSVLSFTPAINRQVCASRAAPFTQSATRPAISCGSSACSCVSCILQM